MGLLRRFVNWLMGIPSPERLDARRSIDAERDLQRTHAIREGDRSNVSGRGSGGGSTLG